MSKRYPAAILFALIATAAASGHFVFLVPVDGTKGKAVFSDTLKPDDKGVPVERIAGTRLSVIDGGKATDLAWTHDKAANCYTFEVPGTGTRIVVGTTDYGVFQRGDSKPMWLRYFPKAVFGDIPSPEKGTVGDKVPVELVPVVDGGKLRFKALAAGKPLAKTEVTVLVPGEEKNKVVSTDDNGLTEAFDKPGSYGAQVRLVEEKAGEKDGKKYEEVRQYATLVVTFGK
jgi:uncharacterized GH25 family protein